MKMMIPYANIQRLRVVGWVTHGLGFRVWDLGFSGAS